MSNNSLTPSEHIPPLYTLEIPSYGFHLLSWSEGEEAFTLSLDYEGDAMPSEDEIKDHLSRYIKGYSLSRWFERILLEYGVPWIITPIDQEDWSDKKIISARWGHCPIYFTESMDEFSRISGQQEQID